ncbi:MAG: hypothetical protein KC544_12940 [Gemmatimonadetes bacterium]|nr:hypothetical protein [Gemmatimonadota bacterium]HPE12815.1 hypothetical protein [Actinomycetota bacterium]
MNCPEWPQVQVAVPSLLGQTVVALLKGKVGASQSKERLLSVGFIRLVAKAVDEFNEGGEAVVRMRLNADLIAGVRAGSSIENCIVTLHRALLYLDAFKAMGVVQADGATIGLRPRDLPVRAPASRNRIDAMRNAIEHMDERLRNGDYPVGVPVGLTPYKGRLDLEGVSIEVQELAGWLQQLAELARRIATHGVAGRSSVQSTGPDQ